MGKPVPLAYEWLLAVKGRIGTWIDVGGLTPAEARTALREAQWVLGGMGEAPGPLAGQHPGFIHGRSIATLCRA